MTVGLPDEISVPEAVRQILTRSYPVYQSLKMRVVNFHALAELIQPEVKEMTHRDASINTLVVAIKRFSDTLSNSKSPDTSRVLKGEDLAFKWHSRRDDKSTKDPVLNHSQGIIKRSRGTLRVSSHLPSLKLDQTDPARGGLRSRPDENGAS